MDNARNVGNQLKGGLLNLKQKYPGIITHVRGLGLMVGIELATNVPGLTVEGKTPATRFVTLLHESGLLTIPAGTNIIRILPALNLRAGEADEGLGIIASVMEKLAS